MSQCGHLTEQNIKHTSTSMASYFIHEIFGHVPTHRASPEHLQLYHHLGPIKIKILLNTDVVNIMNVILK